MDHKALLWGVVGVLVSLQVAVFVYAMIKLKKYKNCIPGSGMLVLADFNPKAQLKQSSKKQTGIESMDASVKVKETPPTTTGQKNPNDELSTNELINKIKNKYN